MLPSVLRRALKLLAGVTGSRELHRWIFSRRPAAPRLGLEILESRLAPAILNWINSAGGDWDTAGNWDLGRVPGAGDNAVISQTGITVTHNTGAGDAINSLTSNAALNISAGTLSLAADSSINAALTLSGGTLDGAGNCTISGLLSWTGGTMSGSGTTVAQGSMALGGGSVFGETLDGRTLNNYGTATWQGTSFNLQNGAVWNNEPGSVLDSQANGQGIVDGGGAASSFNNQGILKVSAGSDTITIGVALNNSGSVLVQSGTLLLKDDSTGTGSFQVSAGATLTFWSGTHNFNSGASVSGAGSLAVTSYSFLFGYVYGTVNFNAGSSVLSLAELTVSGGIVNFNAGSSVPSLANLTISGGTNTTVNFSTGNTITLGSLTESGTLTDNDTVTVSGLLSGTYANISGSGTIVAQGGMALDHGVYLSSCTLDNYGTATLGDSSSVYLGNGAIWNNEPGSVLDCQANGQVIADNSFVASSFNNQGTFKVSGGSGTVTVSVALNNSGSIQVQSGTLSLTNGSTDTGSFTVSADATLNFGGGTHNFNSGASVSGAGSLMISWSTVNFSTGNTITLGSLTESGGTLTGSDTVTVSGLLTWTGGTMSGSGTTVAQGGITIGFTYNSYFDYYDYLDGRTLNNYGTATTSTLFYLRNGAVWNNEPGSVFDCSADSYQSIASDNGVAGSFNNQGILKKSAGTGRTDIAVSFNNSGSVLVQSGTLSLTGGGTDTGSFTVSAGATLNFGNNTHNLNSGASVNGAGSLGVSGGTVNFNAGTSVSSLAALTISGGTANFSTGSTITTTTLTESGGTLTGSDTVTVSVQMSWSGGTMTGSGSTVTSGGLTVTNVWVGILDGRTLDNQGNAVILGSFGNYLIGNRGTIVNEVGATWDIRGDNSGWPGITGDPVFNNQGTLKKSAGTDTTYFSAILNNSGSVLVQSGTLNLGYGGTDTGSFTVSAGATLNFGGGTHNLNSGSSVSGAGNLVVSYGTVNFNTGSIVPSLASLTVSSGTANFSTGSTITLGSMTQSGGTLTGSDTITVNGQMNWSGGPMTGSGTTVVAGTLSIDTTQSGDVLEGRTLDNRGSVAILGSSSSWLPVANGATIRNEAGATWDFLGDASVLPQDGAASLFNNQGTLKKSSGTGTSAIGIHFNNSGSVQVQSGTLDLQGGGTLQFDGYNLLASQPAANVSFTGNLLGQTKQADKFAPQGTTQLDGSGTSSAPQLLEVMSQDLGASSVGYTKNFTYGTLSLGYNTYVRLIDNAHNSAGTGSEALYVNGLIVPYGTTLDLNGLHLYARGAQIQGHVINGSVQFVPAGGALALNTPAAGAINSADQVNDWTFFGRSGQTVTVVAGTGSSGNLPAPAPAIGYAQLTLLDSSGHVLGTFSNGQSGTAVTLAGVALPADGTYHVHVQEDNRHYGGTGLYSLIVADATVHTAPLTVNQTVTGQLGDNYSIDNYTFSVTAGEQIQLKVVAAGSPDIQFDLTGSDRYTAFSGSTTSSDLITLPTAGTYTVSVHTVGLAGAYAFQVNQTSVTPLALNTSYSTAITGSGQAQLFTFTTTESNSILVRLTDLEQRDHNEVYVRQGIAPTRDNYSYLFDNFSGSDQQVIFTSSPGTYYILVYNDSVPTPGTFNLEVQSAPFIVTGMAPRKIGNGFDSTLIFAGALPIGYHVYSYLDPQTHILYSGSAPYLSGDPTVQFLAADGTVYPTRPLPLSLVFDPSKFSSQLLSNLGNLDQTVLASASVPANTLPAGTYSARITNSTGYSQTLTDALTIVQGGIGILKTSVIVPNPIGYHIASTIYVQYSNEGTAPMPAPLLTLTATQKGQEGALMTLDASKRSTGFWTSSTPDGYSQSVQFLGSGVEPGVLLPGESITVPVYYAGWLNSQWDFSRPPINFQVSALTDDNVQTIDWTSLKSSLKPTTMSQAAWDAIFPNLTAQLGSTWGDYIKRLDADSQYLNGIGETVTDISQLISFEVQQAIGFTPLSSLASATDAQVAAPGLDLSLSRTFQPSLVERNQFGRFGWGWTDSWQTSITVDSDGSVNVHGPGGSLRRFQPDLRGGYFAQSGDHGTLAALSGGGYTLTELDGQVTAYNADGTLNYVQDTNGNRITAGYTNGLLTSLTHSSGQSLTLAYNSANLVSSITDSAGRTTTYTYDSTNQYLLSVTTFDGQTTSYTYDTGTNPATAHALLSVAHSNGTHDYFSYDAQGRLADAHRDGGANDTTFAYNEGQVIVTDALNDQTVYSFDNRGLLISVQNPLGHGVQYAYDQNLNLVQMIDAAGQLYKNTYDSQGNLLSSTDPLGHTVNYTYSSTDNRLASVTDANGNTTSYGYDGQGNLTSTTYADGTIESVAYDPIGNVLSNTNRRGQAIHYTYDTAGNVLTKTFPDGSQVVYTYDAHENLTSATDSTGTTTLTYDSNDRLTQITYPSGRFLKYSYDAAGRRTQMVDQDGFTVNYTYDSLGRLGSLTDGSNNLVVQYTYDSVGRLSREDKGNGTYTTYEYDAASELLHLINYAPDGTINSRFDYTYDALGHRITEATVDGTWTYSYDAVGQLTHAVFASTNLVVPSQDLAYAYDPAGNRTQTIINGITTTYTTNNLNEYTQVGSTTYGYDADDNLVSQTEASGTVAYTYNPQNQLIGITGQSGSLSFKYDAFANRVATTANGQTTEYLIDPSGLGVIVTAYNDSAALIDHYTYGLGLTSHVDMSGSSYYDYDAIGSVVGIVDSHGALSSTSRYLPFGQTLSMTGSNANLFQFVGQFGSVSISYSGLTAFGAREYDSSSGRFLTQDPLGLAGGDANLYRYVENNPITMVDPTGFADGPKVTGIGIGIEGYTDTHDNWNLDVTAGPLVGNTQIDVIGVHNDNNHWDYHFPYLDKADSGLEKAKPYLNKVQQFFHTKDNSHSSTDSLGIDWTGRDYRDFNSNLASFGVLTHLPFSSLFNAISSLVHSLAHSFSATVTSTDPNALYGPAGYGPAGFVAPDTLFPYRTDFENNPTATAPAQRVDITNHLDPSLDWNTFQLTGFGFGDTYIDIPAGRQHYQTTVPMTYNGETFQVLVGLDFNAGTGTFHASFQSIDPNTSLPPDVLTGFLPPEDGTGRGEGYVSYTVQPKSGLPTGTQIRTVAQVQFDLGEIIATDQVAEHDPSQGVDPNKQALVTIDVGPPTSNVNPLPTVSNPASFTVSWQGQDDTGGSGIASYDVYVSDNGGPFTLWQSATAQTSAVFTGQDRHSYAFYSVAADNVGNVQATPTSAQATTVVDLSAPTSSVAALPAYSHGSFTVSWLGQDNSGGPGITAYDVYVSDNGGPFTLWQAATTQTSATYTGQDGHRYGFYSIATDSQGTVQATPVAAQASTTVDTSAPTSSVAALPAYSPSSFTVKWVGQDNGSGIASYNVYVSDNGGASTLWQSATPSTSATYTGQDGHVYTFYSIATDNLGNEEATPASPQATTQVDAVKPASSVDALPALSKGAFTVSWSGQDNTGGSGIAGYSIYVSDNGSPFTLWQSATTQTSATYTGQDGHSYSFYSVATDNAGNVETAPVTAQATTWVDAVAPSSSVHSLSSYSLATFTVSWTGQDSSGGSGIAGYNVYVSDNGGAYTLWQSSTSPASASFTGQDGHTYGFYSIATDNAGNIQATPSNAQASTQVDTAPPTSKVSTLAAHSPASFTVRWTGQDGGGSGVASYNVYVSDNGGPFSLWKSETTRTSAAYTGLDGHSYGFYSVAIDNVGNGQPTPNSAQATTVVDSSLPLASHLVLVVGNYPDSYGYPTTWQVIEDGQVIGDSYTAPPSIQFSPDGSHLAFAAATGTGSYGNPTSWEVVEDGQAIGGTYPSISSLKFSPDGSHLAFVAATTTDSYGNPTSWEVIEDGQVVGGSYASVSSLQFSPDSKHLAFVAATGTDSNGNPTGWQVIEDGQAASASYVAIPLIQFSSDSKHLTLLAAARLDSSGFPTGWQVIKDGQAIGATFAAIPSYDGYYTNPAQFSPDGNHLVFLVSTSTDSYGNPTDWQLVEDGQAIGGTYLSISSLLFSPDGSHLAFLAATATDSYGNPTSWEVIEDGQAVGGSYASVSVLQFSPDSKHLAFVAATGTDSNGNPTGWQVIEDGQAASASYIAIPLIQFSSDSKHLSFLAAASLDSSGFPTDWQMIKDGQAIGATFAAIPYYDGYYDNPAQFSPDGNHLVFLVSTSTDSYGNPTGWQLIEDGQAIGDTYPSLASLQFSPDGNHLAFLVATSTDSNGIPTDWQVIEDGQPFGSTYASITSLQFSPAPLSQVSAPQFNAFPSVVAASNVASASISGTADANAAISLAISDGTLTVTKTTTADATGAWSFTGVSLSTLSDGALTITVTATDGMGQKATTTVNAAKKTQTSVTIRAETGPVNATNKNSASISGTAEAGDRITLVISDGIHTVTAATTAGNGNWSIPGLNLSPLSDGPITCTATATDNVGNTASTATTTMVDTIPPSSGVSVLPANSSASFTVHWSGQDSGSGLAGYNVYVSDNGSAFTPLLTNTTQTSTTFGGLNGHTYGFYSIATDAVGNIQATPAIAQATTRVDAVAPTSSVNALPGYSAASFAVSWSGQDNEGGSGIASYSIYVSDNGASTELWQTSGGPDSAVYNGLVGHTYAFSSIATDNVGNAQSVSDSAQATTTIVPVPSVTTQPPSQKDFAGTLITFLAAASGTPAPTVQWQLSTDGGHSFQDIAGATSATLTFTASAAQSGNEYQAVFTNAGGSITTNPATLTINPALAIVANPTSQTVPIGQMATFTANGSGTPKPTVQWQVSYDGGSTFSNIPNATAPTYSFPATAAQNGNLYRAVFSNSAGQAATTAAKLTVNFTLQVGKPSQTLTVAAGTPITLTAAALGSPGATVQWQVSPKKGQPFTVIPDATALSYTFTPQAPDSGKLYQAVFSKPTGAKTGIVTLIVDVPPGSTTGSANQTVAAGTSQKAIFTASAGSGTPTPTVQWQVSSDGGLNFSNLSGATSTTLTLSHLTAAQDGNRYRAVFSNPVGQASTPAATLTVTYAPIITLPPRSQTVLVGQTATFTAAASGDPTPTTVQWQVSGDGSKTYSNIPGANSTTLTVPATAVQNRNLYRAVFSNSIGQTASTAAKLTVNFTLQLLGQPQALTVAPGTPITLTTVLPPGGVPVKVQWQVSSNNGQTFTNIRGATGASYTFTAQLANNGNLYQVVLTRGGSTTTTATFTLTVDALPTVASAPLNQTVASGQPATFTATATGTPTPAIQWQISTDGGLTFTNIDGATLTQLTVSNVTSSQNRSKYRVVLTNPAGQVFSRAAVLTVIAG